MGMFSSLFGGVGSDKADKMRQQAYDAFNAVKTPELSALQVKLQDAVVAGKITPEQAEAQLLNSNAFNSVKADPSLAGAAKQALIKLQDTASQGGLDAIDKSKLQSIRDQQEQENRSSNEAIMADAQRRGTGNSNLSTVNSLIQQQSSADRASKAGTDVAAQAQARALAALTSAGSLGQSLDAQDFGQQATKAATQNDIDKFNATNTTDMRKFNVGNDLNAQGANVANAQHVSDANTGTHNAETINNANANQTVFNDEMAKASGKAGVLGQWANSADADNKAENGADLALTGGLINGASGAAGFAMGGPAGAAVAPKVADASTSVPNGYMPKTNNQLSMYSEGGEVKPEDNSSIEDQYDKFMQTFSNGGTVKMADGGSVTIKPGQKKDVMPIEPTPGSSDFTLSTANNEPIGDFSNYVDAAAFAEKVRSKMPPEPKNFVSGGEVPGEAKVEGDSKKNDVVPALLSPGEVVIPRSQVAEIQSNPNDPMSQALKRLKNPPQVGSARG